MLVKDAQFVSYKQNLMYTKYILVGLDKTMTCLYTLPMGETGRCFCAVRKIGFFLYGNNHELTIKRFYF
jgi:hypothetical protein